MTDFEDFAAHLCGLDPEGEYGLEELDDQLIANHNITLDDLETAVALLLPCTMPLKGPFTDNTHHCFGEYNPKTGVFRAFVKAPVKDSPS